ncbi:DsbC family protein [Vibrio profundi]|uniref:DsbC family protein n=1 Tax=Vibrio profundi TaxID=1774960 RepID=UPI00373700D4
MKKFVISMLAGLSLTANAAVELKAPEQSELKQITASLKKQMTEAFNLPSVGISINGLVQLSDSDNYMFKLSDGNGSYTMTYMKDIESLLIHQNGSILDLKSGSYITQDFDALFAAPLLASIDEKDVIAYDAKDAKNADTVIVFSDPTCGYCRKLHGEMDQYQEQMINIHYLPFPRSGTQGPGYEMLVNTYCAEDRKAALHQTKVSNSKPERKAGLSADELQACEATVAKYYELGKTLGVTGTPAIFTMDGHQVGGYVPAAQLKQRL